MKSESLLQKMESVGLMFFTKSVLIESKYKIRGNYLTFFKYKFFVFAWSDVKNKINIVPTKTENTVVTSKTSIISPGK